MAQPVRTEICPEAEKATRPSWRYLYLDEVFIKIRGELYHLWRAVDQDGDTIDIPVQKRRNKLAAKRSFCKLLKG
jgi:transposase-like protein